MPWVYILRCADQSLYVGLTTDLERRLQEHRRGEGGGYTLQRRPVELVHSEKYEKAGAARARERQLKRWSAKKKEALILADQRALQRLARRRVYYAASKRKSR